MNNRNDLLIVNNGVTAKALRKSGLMEKLAKALQIRGINPTSIYWTERETADNVNRIQFAYIVILAQFKEYYSYTDSFATVDTRNDRKAENDCKHYAENMTQGTIATTSEMKRFRNICNKWADKIPSERLYVFDTTDNLGSMDRPFIDYPTNKDTDHEYYKGYDLALWKRATSLEHKTLKAAIDWREEELPNLLNVNWIICPHCNEPTYYNQFAECYVTKNGYAFEWSTDSNNRCERCNEVIELD